MKLYTGRFQNRQLPSGRFNPVPICAGMPRWSLPYELGSRIRDLAPAFAYLKAPREEYTEHYRQHLASLGVERIRFQLELVANERPMVLLCFEDLRKPELWCHRRLFADWWLEQTGEFIPELEEDSQLGMF